MTRATGSRAPGPDRRRPGTATRLFFTVWLVYAIHATTNVARETYLAMSIAEDFSVRVDRYLGLHPDLFEIEGRGSYINNNPGAGLLGAIPYLAARPALALLFRLRPGLIAQKPPATYDDPRPNREPFLNLARARGLDIKLGLAALVTGVGLMAPLGAAAAVLVFGFYRRRLDDERLALGIAVLYALVTPIFFRSAFLNQNAIVSHAVLGAALLLLRPGAGNRTWVAVGGLLGLAVLNDYSGASMVPMFAAWVAYEGWTAARVSGAAKAVVRFGLGASVPVLLLLGYQWVAFGNPMFPAQTYMPETSLSTSGWFGLSVPGLDLLWRNMLDPRFGLLIFCPMLAAAVAYPWSGPHPTRLQPHQAGFLAAAAAALYLFSSANQFAALQWNTGVRYLVPSGTLIFFLAVPVLLRMRPPLFRALVLPTAIISWSVAMTREAVPRALAQVFGTGLELPIHTVLEKTASGYWPEVADGTSPIAVFLVTGVILWLLWKDAPWDVAGGHGS